MEIEKICRTCLALSGPLLSIYDNNSDDCIAVMLSGFTKIKPARGDNLPEKVCLSCISEINHCYTFKLKCENSNRTLRQLLPDAAVEEVEEVKAARPVMQNKSVQAVLEKCKSLNSIQVQTEKGEQRMVTHQEVQTEYDVQEVDNDSSDSVQMKSNADNVNDIEDTPEDDSKNVFEQLEKRGMLCFKVDEDEQNENEIIFELLDNSDAANEERQVPKVMPKKTKRPDMKFDEAAAYIEIEDTMAEDDTVKLVATKEANKNRVVHNKNRILEHNANVTQSLDAIEEAMNEMFDDSTEREQDYNFTIYEEAGETKVVPRRRATRSATRPDKPAKSKSKRDTQHDATDSHINDSKESAKIQNVPMNKQLTIQTKTEKVEKDPQACKSDAESATAMVELKYFCDWCDAGFALSKSLNYHRQQKACNAKTFRCDECDRVFISEEHLNDHQLTHVLANTCTECSQLFTTPDQLSAHMITAHKRNARHQCNVCKKVFTMTSALRDHLRTHSGERPFLCTICGKGFTQNANLKQHVLRHSSVKKFKCNQCTYSFVTKAELASHMRRHTGDAPYKCEYCDSAFTTSSALLKHRRKHTGERPYACDICPMRFTALNVLKNHRRTHTGEKPYKCPYCSRAFTQKGDCDIHQRTHAEAANAASEPTKTHACPCGKKFRSLNRLRVHSCAHTYKGKKKILNASVSSATKVDSTHITILPNDLSLTDTFMVEDEAETSQERHGEEELMNLVIGM